MLVTLDKDTVSFIRFIIILQAKELNKGRIKYHMYCMRQTFKYKSWGFSLSAIWKKTTTFIFDCHLTANMEIEIK